MKNFFIALGKAACYVILFIGVQTLVTTAFLYTSVFSTLLSDPEAFVQYDPAAISELAMQMTSAVADKQNIIYLIAAVLTMGVLILFFRMRGKRLTRETWAMPIKIASLWPVVLLSLSFTLVICYGISYIPWPSWAVESYDEMYSLTNGGLVVMLITTVVAAPILEETVYRGLVFTRLCRGMPAVAAAILAATVFGAMHGTLIWAAYAFAAALMMTFIYTKYRSLYASILFHMLFNFIGGYLISFIPESGPAFDMPLIGVCAVTTVVLCRIIYKMPREKIDKIRLAQ